MTNGTPRPLFAWLLETTGPLATAGRHLSRWRFEKHPQEQLRAPESNKLIDLENCSAGMRMRPVVIFASRLYLQGFDTLQQWPRLLRTVALRAWLDPDPRPAELRDPEERRDIERLTPLLGAIQHDSDGAKGSGSVPPAAGARRGHSSLGAPRSERKDCARCREMDGVRLPGSRCQLRAVRRQCDSGCCPASLPMRERSGC